MKNFIQKGDSLNVTAPAAVSSGDGVKLGQIFGVAVTDAANGADLVIKTEGVFELDKVGSQAWTIGALVYWDDSNKYCTTTASGNVLIGVATAAVGSGAGETLGNVRLNGSFLADEA